MGRVCNKCLEHKELTEFAINSKGKFGVKSVCKACSTKAGRTLYQRRKRESCPKQWSKEKREESLKKNYGLSSPDYNSRLKKQGGVCLICSGVNKNKYLEKHIDRN